MGRITSVGCEVVDDYNVVVYDQNGGSIDHLNLGAKIENAYSTGRGIVIETEQNAYIYSLRGDHLEHKGTRYRDVKQKQPPDDLAPKLIFDRNDRHDISSDDEYCPEPPSGGSGIGCWGKIAIVIGIILLAYFFPEDKDESDSETTKKLDRAHSTPNEVVGTSPVNKNIA